LWRGMFVDVVFDDRHLVATVEPSPKVNELAAIAAEWKCELALAGRGARSGLGRVDRFLADGAAHGRPF
jgi:hypothetical protein